MGDELRLPKNTFSKGRFPKCFLCGLHFNDERPDQGDLTFCIKFGRLWLREDIVVIVIFSKVVYLIFSLISSSPPPTNCFKLRKLNSKQSKSTD